MKRFKIFIVAIISILLIVTIGKLAFAEEYGIELDIERFLEDGTVYLDGNTFKKYTNVQCVQRGTSFKRGYFKITASADIQGETVELTRYGKGNVGETENWNYPTAISTTTVKDSPESNILAAILTSADYSHGYYITEEDMENGKRADSQLAIWYYWNQWSNSLPTEGGLDWGNVFPYSVSNEEKNSQEGALNEYYDEGRALVEQGVFEKYDETNPNHKIANYKYIKSTDDGSYIIPEDGVYDDDDDRYRKLWSGAREIATAHEYYAKIYLVQFYDYKSGEDTDENKNRNAQNLIIYEPKEPIKKLTLEKKWDDSENKYNVRPDSITAQITAYARNDETDTYEPTDVFVYKENEDGTLYTNENGEYVLENRGRTYEVELSEEKDWKKEIRVRSKDDTDTLIYYAIKEIQVDGYELDDEATVGYRELNKNVGAIKIGRPNFIADDEIFGTNWSAYIELANKLDGKVNIRAIKVWDDQDDLDGYRPTSITVTLKEDGNLTDKKATLDESNNWTYTFEGLEKYKKNSSGEWNEVNYEIVEDEIIVDNEKPYESQIPEPTVTEATETEPETITFTITNTHTPHYDGYIEINGKVWLDKQKEVDGKLIDINGVLNDWETGIGGIKVVLKDANGKQFDETSTAETREDGTYTIKVNKVNYDNSKGVYKLYDNAEEVKKKLLTSYVEFEYDGMLFTTVTPMASEEENQIVSKAKEIEGSSEAEATRKYVDGKYDEVFGENEADIRNTDATPELQLKEDNSGIPYLEYQDKYWNDKNVKATTQNVISFDSYRYKTTDTRTETVRYCQGDSYIRTNPKDASGPIEDPVYIGEHTEHSKQCTRTYDVEIGVINDVNLGLFKREQPEIGITTDLKNVEVMMNNQKYTYIYDAFVEENQNVVGMKTDFQNKYTYTYRGPVNPATVAEAIKENHENISVNVTYKIMVKNHSNTLNTNIHKIVNYFDLEYTLNTPGWTIINNDDHGRKFNKAISNDLNKILGPNEEFEMNLTYTISLDAIKGLLQQNATLNNASEIESFSTTYGENTPYAELQKGGRAGEPYAGYTMGNLPDCLMKSHPGNSGMYLDETEQRLKIQVSEVDTDIAPSFVLFKDDPKILSGNIWEDNDKDNTDNKRLGNGFKDDGIDSNVANVKVQLYKVETEIEENGEVKVKRDVNGNPIISNNIALLYKTIPTINADGTITIETKPAEVYSNADGYFAFGDSEYGVPTGAYIIKYTYGNGIDGTVDSKIGEVVINARNYKSTIITPDSNEMLYTYYKDNQINDQWHLNTTKGHSVAVDNMEQRVAITDLKYSNFDEAVNISAYSQPFVMQVEFDKSAEKQCKIDENGRTPFGNELNIFDFGIVERAHEDLFVEKTINDIQITQGDPLNGGLTITSGNPNTGALNWVKAMGFGTTSTNGSQARMANEKLASIELDVTLIQNSQLYIEYALRVVNNSEIDYDYYLGNESEPYDPSKVKTEYYYFGTTNEEGEDNIITSSINEVVDFVDTDLNYEYPTGWDRKDETYFTDEGLLNEDTIKLVKDGKYAAYVTTIYEDLAPGEPSTVQTIKAQRTLTNSSENKYENHAEILKIDSKVARTIKGRQTAGGNIEVKEYKMGNFVPSTALRTRNNEGYVKVGNEAEGLHEQDDDTVILAIGTPTGVTNYTLHYIIVTVVALIVIIFGVIFIKKKVLTK